MRFSFCSINEKAIDKLLELGIKRVRGCLWIIFVIVELIFTFGTIYIGEFSLNEIFLISAVMIPTILIPCLIITYKVIPIVCAINSRYRELILKAGEIECKKIDRKYNNK
ncbi:MAG: hypothetical protein IJH34_13390 [Romboutsia sp.]|nr:hypothetical protein [Romboutsia sp.]